MTRLQVSLLGAFLLTACDSGSAPSAAADAGAEQAGAAQGEAVGAKAPAPEPAKPATVEPGELGSIAKTDAVDLAAIAHKTPAQVEALLGAHEETGSDRISCVRFLPERVFFACKQEIRTYAHPEFERIRVEYEDGRAALVALTGLPGSGELDPVETLDSVGIRVPGEPRYRSEGVADGAMAHIWEWGNSSARLVIDGQQFRVRLSIVDEEWARSKLELINNNPLDDDQKSRIKLPRTAEPPASEAPASEAPAN